MALLGLSPANCYVTKPVDFVQFLEVVCSIESFWLMVVFLPPAATSVTSEKLETLKRWPQSALQLRDLG